MMKGNTDHASDSDSDSAANIYLRYANFLLSVDFSAHDVL